MNKRIRGSLLLVAFTLTLAACGTTTTTQQPTAVPAATAAQPTITSATALPEATEMSGMDHGSLATEMPMPTMMSEMATAVPTMDGMDHGSMPHGDAPYDALFIDSMIEHHQGAIDMANQALKEAEKPEIQTLAQEIIKAQEAEIAQMRQWRAAWYADLPDTGGMSMGMGDMEISSDTSKPFDQRFIEAMISHHEGAIAMAKDAQQNAEHAEIKTLAQEVITAQEAEIALMRQWLQTWFPQ
ncbi:MAG TPA: DUF305 domain-containing protein [Roseiflexaceae bacterium]|nr:DUF305 domain-containing protein [Roseiflexaceae bacterium]